MDAHFALSLWGSLNLSLTPEKSALTPITSLQPNSEGDLLVPGIALTQCLGIRVKNTQSPSLEPHAYECPLGDC